MGGKEKSADDVKGDAISKLLAGDVAGFDKELQETMRGPAGADIRRDHLREHIADHLFNGDYDTANRVMGLPYAALGGLTIYEAAATHDGMLQVKTRSEEHTSELQSLMRTSYAVFSLKKK